MLGKSIKWFWQDDLVTELKVQEPNPLEIRIQRLESELKRVISPREKSSWSPLGSYFDAFGYRVESTLESRIQALEDAKKPRCKTCKKIK